MQYDDNGDDDDGDGDYDDDDDDDDKDYGVVGNDHLAISLCTLSMSATLVPR